MTTTPSSRVRSVRTLLSTAAAIVVISAVPACSDLDVVIPPDRCRTGSSGDTRASNNGGQGGQASLTPSGPIRLPVEPGTTAFTSGFGPRDGTVHKGVDLAGPVGTKILAALDGVVVAAGATGEGPGVGFENWIIIDSLVDGKPVSTVYGHMFPDGVHVREGQTVKAGDDIAGIGNAGGSSGPHLHFEYWEGGRLQGGNATDPVTKLPALSAQAIGGSSSRPNTQGPGSDPVQLVANSNPLTASCSTFGVPGGGDLASGVIPPEFEPWVRKAGTVCPQIKSPLIASQLYAENQFRWGAGAPVSETGAMGPAQFMPGTWATWGKDYDGDGKVDPNSIGDAVMSQAHFMCALYQEVDAGTKAGRVRGDGIENTLAAYNAGYGAVEQYGGIPPYAQTMDYVPKIIQGQAAFTNPNSRGEFVPTGSGDGAQIVEAARQHLGVPYVWGGTGPDGFDCSGLTSVAVNAASGGKVSLPRTSEQQWTVGVEIPIDQAQPGDLVFGSWADAGPGHVGIYAGNGQMVHAPTTGDVVKEAPVQADMKARRVM